MFLSWLVYFVLDDAAPKGSPPAEARAIAFLAREVPSWSKSNKCFSCHNNGDAARALYQARARQYAVPRKALDETTRWLADPQRWDHNGGEGPFNDKVLARIQFSAALTEAVETGASEDRQALLRAAELVAGHQQKTGEWKVNAGAAGSPVTYGPCLATALCRHTLAKADPQRFRTAIDRADRWLREVTARSVMDAGAVLLALGDSRDDQAATQRSRCLGLIRQGEGEGGGWGPFVNSAPEAFDTALVLLALSRSEKREDVRGMIRRGRAYLLATQNKDGSWPETTRPAGAESYAQRISTTGWVLQALLATAEPPR